LCRNKKSGQYAGNRSPVYIGPLKLISSKAPSRSLTCEINEAGDAGIPSPYILGRDPTQLIFGSWNNNNYS
jgi:hypothetical protein